MYLLFTMTVTFVMYFGVFFEAQGLMLVKVMFPNEEIRLGIDRFVEEYEVDVWLTSSEEMILAVSNDLGKQLVTYFNCTILNPNLGNTLKKSLKANENARKKLRGRSQAAPLTYFASYKTIVNYMKQVVGRIVGRADLRSIGRTYENRDMKVIRFGTGPETKPAILILCGQHGREWLAIGNCVYSIHTLSLGILRQTARIMKLLQKFDFYIIPVGNPDGYENTKSNPTKRFWRKTMSKQGYGCKGVDANRNFNVDYQPHDETCVEDPCFIQYRGPRAFSEACTRNIRDFVFNSSITNRIKLFFDMHSYAQQFYIPYGYNSSKSMVDIDEVIRVATISRNALEKVNRRKFSLGLPGILNYNASGIAMDWFKEVVGVKYSYTIESYPTPHSPEGFLVEPNQIILSGKETVAAIMAAAENIII